MMILEEILLESMYVSALGEKSQGNRRDKGNDRRKTPVLDVVPRLEEAA
jgi:hypothetical protein